MENKKIDFEVVQQIEVLREMAAGVLADMDRYIEEWVNKEDAFIVGLKDTLVDVYDGIYDIRSMKEAMIARGKLQIINDSLKKVMVEKTPGSNEMHKIYEECRKKFEPSTDLFGKIEHIDDEEEKEFFVMLCNFFLQQGQKETIANEVY